MNVIQMHPRPDISEQVQKLSALGATTPFILRELGITEEILTEHYLPDQQYGIERANMEVAEAFFSLAKSGKVPEATVRWMRMKAGWSDTPAVEEPDDENILEQARQKLKELLHRRSK